MKTQPIINLFNLKKATTIVTLAVAALTASPIWAEPVSSLTVDEVTFENEHDVYRDTGTQAAYPTPHWKRGRTEDVDGDGDQDPFQSPVCYARNVKPKADAKFTVSPANATQPIKIKGTAGSYVFGPVEVTPSGGTATFPATEASQALPNEIRPGTSPFNIHWQFSKDGGTSWSDAGSSQSDASSSNTVYVTLGNPVASKLFHTVVHIGCSLNAGQTNPDTVVTNIWSEFSDRSVNRIEIPAALTYWDPNPSSVNATDTAGLLAAGKGQCGSWASFFQDCLAAQGVSSTFHYLFPVYQNQVPDPEGRSRGRLLIKDWTFGISNADVQDSVTFKTFTHTPSLVADNPNGAPGQSNINPPGWFNNHFIVKYGGKYYDPSYGGVPYSPADTDAGKAAWEDASLDGFGKYFVLADASTTPPTIVYEGYLYKANEPGASDVETVFSTLP